MNDDIQIQLLELANKQLIESQKQTELYTKSIETSEKKAIECSKLRLIEEGKLEELKRVNLIKHQELEQSKLFNQSIVMLVEQNKATINEIESFIKTMNNLQDDNPLTNSIKLLLTFFQTIQLPLMIEIVKQMGVSVNQNDYIKRLEKMNTEIGSARSNINQNSGLNVGRDFTNTSRDFQYSEDGNIKKE